jgi:hypothetical protein
MVGGMVKSVEWLTGRQTRGKGGEEEGVRADGEL